MAATLRKLVVNLAVWAAFGGALLALNHVFPHDSNGELNAVDALRRLIEPKLVALQAFVVVVLVGLLAILRDKLTGWREGVLVTSILRLSTEEAGSILTNFASLLVVAAFVAKKFASPLITAGLLYLVAYLLLYRPKRTETWTATYPKIPDVVEEVQIRVTGESVSGQIKATQGPDEGRVYAFQGSCRDRMLVGYFETDSEAQRDKGAFALMLNNLGDAYIGRMVYTHDDGKLIHQEWELHKQV
jgi:hypothetical protein